MDADNNGLPPEYYYNVAGKLCCDEVLEEDKMDDESSEYSDDYFPDSPRCRKNLLPLFNASAMSQGTQASTSQQRDDVATSLSNSLEVNLQIKTEVSVNVPPIARVVGQPRVRTNNSFDPESIVRHLFSNESEVETTQFRFDDPELSAPRPMVFQAVLEDCLDFPPLSPPGYEHLVAPGINLLPGSEANTFIDESPPQYPYMSPSNPGRLLYLLNPFSIGSQQEDEGSPTADSAYYLQQENSNFMTHEQPTGSYVVQQSQPNHFVIQHQTINIFPSVESFVVPQQQPGNGAGQNPHPYFGGPSGMGMEAPPPYQGMNGNMAMPPNGPAVTTASWTNFM